MSRSLDPVRHHINGYSFAFSEKKNVLKKIILFSVFSVILLTKMSDRFKNQPDSSNLYNLVDYKREHRKGIAASSFKNLLHTARLSFGIPTQVHVTIVLETDGKRLRFLGLK